MADENKSWVPNIGLLSESSLIGLDEATRDQLQREATKRFVLGGLLSGRPDIAFSSAVGTANDYMQNQSRLLELAEKQRQQQAEEAWAAKYNPTKYQESSPEFAGPVTKDVERLQTGISAAREAGLPTYDVEGALRDLTALRSPRQPAMLEGFKASLPKVGEGGTLTSPGGRYLGTIPQFSPSQGILYGAGVDARGMPIPYSQEIPGAVKTRGRIAAEETSARELNTPRQVPGKSGAPTFIYPPAPAGAGAGVGTGTGAEPPQTANDAALQAAAKSRFEDFSKESAASASTASDRQLAAQRMYDIAERVNGNKFTDLTSEGAAWMRGLPFVGDKFDQYVSDVKMFNVDKSKQVLSGLNNIKGNANGFEGAVVEKAASSITDPKQATKFIAALEMATADKDLARQNFIENFSGNIGQARTAWQNSPDNPRIYNHPKVTQFLSEQVNSWNAIPNKSQSDLQRGPNLPAGFTYGSNRNGDALIKRPDGSVLNLTRGQ